MPFIQRPAYLLTNNQIKGILIAEYGIACGGNWTAMMYDLLEKICPKRLNSTKEYSFNDLGEILDQEMGTWKIYRYWSGPGKPSRVAIAAQSAAMAARLLKLDARNMLVDL